MASLHLTASVFLPTAFRWFPLGMIFFTPPSAVTILRSTGTNQALTVPVVVCSAHDIYDTFSSPETMLDLTSVALLTASSEAFRTHTSLTVIKLSVYTFTSSECFEYSHPGPKWASNNARWLLNDLGVDSVTKFGQNCVSHLPSHGSTSQTLETWSKGIKEVFFVSMEAHTNSRFPLPAAIWTMLQSIISNNNCNFCGRWCSRSWRFGITGIYLSFNRMVNKRRDCSDLVPCCLSCIQFRLHRLLRWTPICNRNCFYSCKPTTTKFLPKCRPSRGPWKAKHLR